VLTNEEPSEITNPNRRARPDLADDQEPMRAYFALACGFLGLTGGALLALRGNRWFLPKPDLLDTALIALGTARLSRLITRDKVMRPLRAPFTVTERTTAGQLKERAKGSGLTRAAGELITCPRCTAVWAATGLCLTYFAWPGAGRFVGLILSSSLVSDVANRKIALLDEAVPRAAANH
jgi:hypothetical protein